MGPPKPFRPLLFINNNNNLLKNTKPSLSPISGLAMRKKKRTRTVSQREQGLTSLDSADEATTSSRQDAAASNTIAMSRRSVASLFSNYTDAASSSDVDASDLVQAPKRLALQDSNISRYEKEFLEIARIGMIHKYTNENRIELLI